MPEGAWAYILGASPVTPPPSTLALSAKVRKSRQEIPAIEELYLGEDNNGSEVS